MPTNDERREIAARLRGLDECVWSPFSVERNDIRKAIGLSFFQDYSTAQRLADLIEPEPERTCHVINANAWGVGECDACGEFVEENDNYCPNCGCRVKEHE